MEALTAQKVLAGGVVGIVDYFSRSLFILYTPCGAWVTYDWVS